MERDFDEGYGQVVGPKKEIEQIIREVIADEAIRCDILANLPDDRYVRFELEKWWEYTNDHTLRNRFPLHACEWFVHRGRDKYDTWDGIWIGAGSPQVEFYIRAGSYWISPPDINRPIERFFASELEHYSLNVTLVDGQKITYTLTSEAAAILNTLTSQPLTIGLLSDICNPYKVQKKRREFINVIRKRIPSIDLISSIEFEGVVESAFEEDDIRRIAQSQAARALPDVSVLRYLNSFFAETEKKIFNYSTNTVKTICSASIFAMEDPAAGKFQMMEIPHQNPVEKVEKLAGLAASDHVDMVYKASDSTSCTCVKCLSDLEVIQVPEKVDGLTVTEIGDGCFEKMVNLKKVILPCTVQSIGVGAFAGCKHLESVTYSDGQPACDDFLICKKGKLVTLITGKAAYTVPEEITEIGKNAFSNCPKLKELTLNHSIKKMSNDALAECSTLKTVCLTGHLIDINIAAFEKGKIKKVVLPTGESVSIHDKCMYDCFMNTGKGLEFSYQEVAKHLSQVSGESNKFKMAMDLIEHREALNEEMVISALEFAVKYSIENDDFGSLTKLFGVDASRQLNFRELTEQANRHGNADIIAKVLEQSGRSGENKKASGRREVPAKPCASGAKLYIKVRFENNKSYSYFCSFDVKQGDKVFADGKMAGMPGEVVAILDDMPSGRAAMYTLEVTQAFRVTFEDAEGD